MPLTNPVYRVAVRTPDGAPTEHTVEITNGDRLRGELEAGRAGLPPMKDAPLNHTAVWVWCALVRLGLYAGKCAPFRNDDLLNMEPVEDADGKPAAVVVDPTPRAAPTGSP